MFLSWIQFFFSWPISRNGFCVMLHPYPPPHLCVCLLFMPSTARHLQKHIYIYIYDAVVFRVAEKFRRNWIYQIDVFASPFIAILPFFAFLLCCSFFIDYCFCLFISFRVIYFYRSKSDLMENRFSVTELPRKFG